MSRHPNASPPELMDGGRRASPRHTPFLPETASPTPSDDWPHSPVHSQERKNETRASSHDRAKETNPRHHQQRRSDDSQKRVSQNCPYPGSGRHKSSSDDEELQALLKSLSSPSPKTDTFPLPYSSSPPARNPYTRFLHSVDTLGVELPENRTRVADPQVSEKERMVRRHCEKVHAEVRGLVECASTHLEELEDLFGDDDDEDEG